MGGILDPQALLEALQQQGGPTPPPPDGSAAGVAPEPTVDTSGQGMGVQGLPEQAALAPGVSMPPMPASPGQIGSDRKGQIRELLGNFLFALGRGLSASASARPGYGSVAGLGGALEAGPELQMMKQQRQAQLAMQQSEMAHRRALENIAYSKISEQQAARESKETIEANKLKAQQAVNEARVGELNAAAGKSRYMSTPVGIFDTTIDPATGKPKGYVAGSYNQPIPVTPELKQMHPGVFDTIPDGEVLSPSVIASFVRAGVFSTVPVMTGAGVMPFSRTTGTQAGPIIAATPPGVAAAQAGKAATPTVVMVPGSEGQTVPQLVPASEAMKGKMMPASGVGATVKMAGIKGQFREVGKVLSDVENGVAGQYPGLNSIPDDTKVPLTAAMITSNNQFARGIGGLLSNSKEAGLAYAVRRLQMGLINARSVMGSSPVRSDAQVQADLAQLPDATALASMNAGQLKQATAGFRAVVERWKSAYPGMFIDKEGAGGNGAAGGQAWSKSAWQKANPGKSLSQAIAAAKASGRRVVD